MNFKNFTASFIFLSIFFISSLVSATIPSVGEYMYPNGDVYKGEFKNGLPHGEGELAEVFKVSTGTISADRTKLVSLGCLDRQFAITFEGRLFLHQVWPKEFEAPPIEDDLPF